MRSNIMATPEIGTDWSVPLQVFGFAVQLAAAGVLQLSPDRKIVGWLLLLGGWITAVIGITWWWVDHFATPSTDSAAKGVLLGAGILIVLPLVIIGWFRRPAVENRHLRPRRVEPVITRPVSGIDEPKAQSAFPPEISAPKSPRPSLKITTGEIELYFSTKSWNLYSTERTFKLRLDNIDPEKAITDIKISVSSVEPMGQEGGPWELESGFTLAAGDYRLIPLVSYGEGDTRFTRLGYGNGDSFFRVLSKSGQPMPPKEVPQIVTIRATGIGTAPCEYQCKVWVDQEDGLFRIGG
jgi:hypothetical protein